MLQHCFFTPKTASITCHFLSVVELKVCGILLILLYTYPKYIIYLRNVDIFCQYFHNQNIQKQLRVSSGRTAIAGYFWSDRCPLQSQYKLDFDQPLIFFNKILAFSAFLIPLTELNN